MLERIQWVSQSINMPANRIDGWKTKARKLVGKPEIEVKLNWKWNNELRIENDESRCCNDLGNDSNQKWTCCFQTDIFHLKLILTCYAADIIPFSLANSLEFENAKNIFYNRCELGTSAWFFVFIWRNHTHLNSFRIVRTHHCTAA